MHMRCICWTCMVAWSGRHSQGRALTQHLVAEARAALAAVEWGTGQQAKAEEQLEAATAMQSGWGKINFVRDHTRWPPRLYAALEKMLSFSPM